MSAAEWFVRGFTLYALAGAAFAVLFLLFGLERIDPVAKGSSPGFRLLIFPGTAALWPLLLIRWSKSR